MPAVVGSFIFPMVGLGIWQLLRRGLLMRDTGVSPVRSDVDAENATIRNPNTSGTGETPVSRLRFFQSHNNRVDLLIVAIPMMIFIGHTVLFVLGKMASSGELRYMMIVAPFWGILAAQGWTWTFDRLNLRRFEMSAAALAAILPFGVNFVYPVLPLRFMPDWQRTERIGKWYESSLANDYPHLAASHPGIFYFLDRPIDAPNNVPWLKDEILTVPKGTVLIWDPVYGIYNADQRRAIPVDELLKAGWEPVTDLPDDIGNFRIFHSKQKQGGTEVSP
jgi:hypothetical protein